MSLLFIHRSKINKNLTRKERKEVKKVKSICALVMATAMIFATAIPMAMAADPQVTIKSYNQVINVSTEYNSFGVAVSSPSTSTTTVEIEDSNGAVTTTTTITTTESSYKNGSLSPDRSHPVSTTKDSEGNVLSKSEYTDTYTYDENGRLTGVSGSGTSESYDPNSGQRRTGTLTRSMLIKNGQALLTNSTTSGDIKDKDGNIIGTFSNPTTLGAADYQYLGGSWVPTREASVSSANMNDGGSETLTRTTTFPRNEHGVITGINQTATGSRIEITGNNKPAKVARQTFTLTNYSAPATFDPQMGWYIASEVYDWKSTQTDDSDSDD